MPDKTTAATTTKTEAQLEGGGWLQNRMVGGTEVWCEGRNRDVVPTQLFAEVSALFWSWEIHFAANREGWGRVGMG